MKFVLVLEGASAYEDSVRIVKLCFGSAYNLFELINSTKQM